MEYTLVFCTYLLLPLAAIALWGRLGAHQFPGVFIVIFGLVPVLLAKLISVTIVACPGVSPEKSHMGVLVLGILAIATLRYLPKFNPKVLCYPASLLALLIGGVAIVTPHYANDPLKYSALSRIFFET